jgi:hypothetical protein
MCLLLVNIALSGRELVSDHEQFYLNNIEECFSQDSLTEKLRLAEEAQIEFV